MGENIEKIKKIVSETEKLDVPHDIIIPTLEGTLQYLYYKTKDYNDIESYKQFINDSINIFENNRKTSESKVTLFTLKKAVNCCDFYKFENMDQLKKGLKNLLEILFESRMFYHEQIFKDPHMTMKKIFNLSQKL